MNLDSYSTFVFDCDGVILNSNAIKTNAFRKISMPFGERESEAFVKYHLQNGGQSRYVKVKYFYESILGCKVSTEDVEVLLSLYSQIVLEDLMGAEIDEAIFALRGKYRSSRWMVVSGGDQKELRAVFKSRNLNVLFDGGIYGSPDDKHSILSREIELGLLKSPAIYFGDSKYDSVAAKDNNLDFAFVYHWTEFSSWREYVSTLNIPAIENFSEIL